MSRSLAHLLVCTKCHSKFSSVIPLEPSDTNCICWDCHLVQQAAASSSMESKMDTVMEAEVASTSKANEVSNEPTKPTSRLCGILKKIKDRANSASPSSSREFSKKTADPNMPVKRMFFKKGMHLPKRGSNSFVCPDCVCTPRCNGFDLVSQMNMLKIRPIDDEDEGVEEDAEIVVDGPEQEVPEHGDFFNHDNFFIRHPHLLGEAMAPMDEMRNPPRRHAGQCGHQTSSFMAKCYVCKRKCDISSPSTDLFGCLICYFRRNLTIKKNRSSNDFYG